MGKRQSHKAWRGDFRPPGRSDVGPRDLFRRHMAGLTITRGALFTLVVMVDQSDPSLARIWHSRATLAEKRGVAPCTISRHVRELECAGVLDVDRAGAFPKLDGSGFTRSRTNRYRFLRRKASESTDGDSGDPRRGSGVRRRDGSGSRRRDQTGSVDRVDSGRPDGAPVPRGPLAGDRESALETDGRPPPSRSHDPPEGDEATRSAAAIFARLRADHGLEPQTETDRRRARRAQTTAAEQAWSRLTT